MGLTDGCAMVLPEGNEKERVVNVVGSLPGQAEIEYGAGVNHDLLVFMGTLHGTVLDIGCGAGTWGPLLRRAGAERLTGLEPTTTAELARGHYDEVTENAVEQIESRLVENADVVIFADVLEHLLDPWQVLREFRDFAAPGAELFVSLPNAQNFRIGLPLLARGQFEYSDAGGPMDRGHLRWFTRATLGAAVAAAGWRIERQSGSVLGRVARAGMGLSRGAAGPVLYHQLFLHARAN